MAFATSRGFNVKPAGTQYRSGTPVSHFEHRKLAPVTKLQTADGTWAGGAELHFMFKSSSSRWISWKDTKLMVEMRVRANNGAAGAPAVSTRLVTCPVSQLFSAARVSLGDKTLETRASHYSEMALFAARNNVSREAGLTAGSGSLLDFDTTMLAADGTHDTHAGVAGAVNHREITQRRNMKQDLLQVAEGNNFEISEGIALDCLSTDAWFPGGEWNLHLIVDTNWASKLVYTQDVASQLAYSRIDAGNNGHTTLTANALATGGAAALLAAAPLDIQIINTHLMCKFATPVMSPMKVPSLSLAYECATYMQRQMIEQNFEVTFAVPPGVRAVAVWSSDQRHDMRVDNGRFAAAGGGKNTQIGLPAVANLSHQAFQSLQCELGGIQAPTLIYSGLDFPHLKAARVYDTALSFLNNSAGTKPTSVDFKEFCQGPIFYLHLLQPSGTSPSVLTVRGNFAGVPAHQQHLCVACIHNRLLEIDYSGDEDEPVAISVQPFVE